ncbi:cation transporter [Croceimicrobium sp.]|uniref:cation transporter n=1 Tax=Croceimicrobium sp. TaxID=2828340 RepID=UPI003BABCD03
MKLQQSLFDIPKMDCPSEENLIRLKLQDFSQVHHLDFDLEQRQLKIQHQGEIEPLIQALEELKLGSRFIDSHEVDAHSADQIQEKNLLWAVLIINLAFFGIEALWGWLANSMGLVADSLDMLADAMVYGLSLWAVGAALIRKRRVAQIAGYLQLSLAFLAFMELIHRFISPVELPDFKSMMMVSAFALLANAICLYLLQKSRTKEEVHMKASLIFTSNDVIINLGVISAGSLVYALNSPWPDLIIGMIVLFLVAKGALRILKLN